MEDETTPKARDGEALRATVTLPGHYLGSHQRYLARVLNLPHRHATNR
jgi:hypothetical protein